VLRDKIVVSDFTSQIGARIRFLRLERGLPLWKLAKLAQSSADSIMHIELGRSAITLQSIYKLARALNVQPFDLLNHDHDTNDVGWLVETMRHDSNVLMFVRATLEPRRRAPAARAARARRARS
jgi:transcriptional regulator with XRE-family HTH domain